MKTKKGDIFEIELEGGKVAFAQALAEPEFAFFEASPLDTNSSPVFRLWVHKSAVIKWNKVGNKELPPELLSNVVFSQLNQAAA